MMKFLMSALVCLLCLATVAKADDAKDIKKEEKALGSEEKKLVGQWADKYTNDPPLFIRFNPNGSFRLVSKETVIEGDFRVVRKGVVELTFSLPFLLRSVTQMKYELSGPHLHIIVSEHGKIELDPVEPKEP
jgi:hypothetical protein